MAAVRAALALLLFGTALPSCFTVLAEQHIVSPLLAWKHLGRGVGRSTDMRKQGAAVDVSYAQDDAQASIVDAIRHAASLQSVRSPDSPQNPLLPLVEEQLSTIVLFIGNQLDTPALSRKGGDGTKELSRILDRAHSSVLLPWAGVVKESVLEELEEARVSVQALGCQQGQAATAAQLQRVLEDTDTAAGQPRVVAICAPTSSSGEDALEAEVQLLASLDQLLDGQGLPFLVIYTSLTPSPSQRRSALSDGKGFGPYKECGQLCQTQVKWLQGILAFLFMALAAGAGMTCLSMLDTPSRFEKPKEGPSS